MNYTLVQHSAFGYAGKYSFQYAVETRSVTGKAAEHAVLKAGGVLLPYEIAEDLSEAENYQPENNGLYPRVPGHFADIKVDGLRVYVPAKVKV